MKKYIMIFAFIITVVLSVYASDSAQPVTVLAGNKGGAYAVLFSKDSKMLITAGADTFVRFWDFNKGVQSFSSGQGSDVRHLSGPVSGKFIVSGSGNSLKLWDPKDGRLIKSAASENMITSIAAAADGDYIASGYADAGKGGINIWQAGSMNKPFLLDTGGNWAKVTAFSADDNFFMAAGGRTISVWNVEYGDIVSAVSGKGGIKFTNKRDFDFGCMVFDAAFSPDSQYFSACGDDGTVKTWRLEDGLIAWKQPAHNGIALSLAFSREFIATAGQDAVINFFAVKSGKPVFSISACAGRVNDIAFSPDGKYIAAACGDDSVPVWKVAKAAVYRFGNVRTAVIVSGIAGLCGIIVLLAVIFRKKKSVKDWEL